MAVSQIADHDRMCEIEAAVHGTPHLMVPIIRPASSDTRSGLTDRPSFVIEDLEGGEVTTKNACW